MRSTSTQTFPGEKTHFSRWSLGPTKTEDMPSIRATISNYLSALISFRKLIIPSLQILEPHRQARSEMHQ